MEMNWVLIVICVLSIMVALKFVKTIGKLLFFGILALAVCGILVGVFNVNPLELIGGLGSVL